MKRTVALLLCLFTLFTTVQVSVFAVPTTTVLTQAASAPAQVKNVKASAGSSSVALSWSKVSGKVTYVVYEYNQSTKKYTKKGSTTATKYTVKNLKSSKTYSFAVRAYTKSGNKTLWGKMSAVVSVKTKKQSTAYMKLYHELLEKNAGQFSDFSLRDINADGIKELIALSNSSYEKPYLMTVYTVSNGKLVNTGSCSVGNIFNHEWADLYYNKSQKIVYFSLGSRYSRSQFGVGITDKKLNYKAYAIEYNYGGNDQGYSVMKASTPIRAEYDMHIDSKDVSKSKYDSYMKKYFKSGSRIARYSNTSSNRTKYLK